MGQPEELSAKLAGQLARERLGPFGPVKIVARDRHEVAFEPAGPSQLGFQGGRVRLQPGRARGPGSTMPSDDLAARLSSIVGWIMLALGLAAVDRRALPWRSPSSSRTRTRTSGPRRSRCSRWCHFLWPPFLIAHLARQPGRMFRARMEALLHNLPYS